MKKPLKLKNAMLMMALAAVYPMQSFAAAGIAQFSAGDVTLRRGAGADQLIKGRDIESGDAIVTGANGRAQVRFSDGGLVSLQPNSQFNISNYADKNDPKQDSFLVDLLRGGMRAVTGLIGKRNRENFKVTTTTATIGIRGSAFNLAYNPDGSLSVSTELDEIEVCTRAGCIGLTAGESALVVSPQNAPIRTSTRASLPTPEPRQEPQIAANQPGVVPTGGPSAPPPPPPPPPAPRVLSGLALSSSGLVPQAQTQLDQAAVVVSDGAYVFNSALYDQRNYAEGTLYFDADGKPQMYKTTTAGATSTGTTTVVSESGTMAGGDYMLLGTWSENTWTEGANTRNVKSTAFVAGLATPTTALAALSGQRGDYAFAAGTPITSSTGATGQLLSDSKLIVDFLGAGNYIDVNLNVRMAGGTGPTPQFQQLTAAGEIDYNLRGSGTASNANFGGQLSVTSNTCATAIGNQCGTGVFTGFLGGNNAEKAAVSFVADTYYHGYINGAGTFTRGPLTTTPTGQAFTTALQGAFMAGNKYNQNTDFGAIYNDNEFTFDGDHLVKFKENGYYSYTIQGTVPGTFGAIGKVTEDDFIGWGQWAAATENYTYGSGGGSGSSVLNSLHYIVGKPTPDYQMPQYGRANYALIGGTNPTATYNGTSQIGQLVSGNLNVSFTYSTVDVNILTRFGTQDVSISSLAEIQTNSGGNTATFRSCNGDNVNGFFTGANAGRAALVYGKNAGGTLGRVAGAAAFQRNSFTPATPQ